MNWKVQHKSLIYQLNQKHVLQTSKTLISNTTKRSNTCFVFNDYKIMIVKLFNRHVIKKKRFAYQIGLIVVLNYVRVLFMLLKNIIGIKERL